MRTRAAARVWSLLMVFLGAEVASSGTIACTTTTVNFASGDAGPSRVDTAVAPSDAPAADAPSPDVLPPIPDASSINAHEVAAEGIFTGAPLAGPSRYVQYKCCLNNSCDVVVQGDDNACRDASTWTLAATVDCESRGLTVAGIGLYVGC